MEEQIQPTQQTTQPISQPAMQKTTQPVKKSKWWLWSIIALIILLFLTLIIW